MYGLINQAVKDLVILSGGEEAWRDVCKKAHLENPDFDMLGSYSDNVTYSLVSASAEKLSLQPDHFLKALGRHWITFTAERGYGEMLNLLGRDLLTCLQNLNRMHAHIGSVMPKLQTPRFTVTEVSSQLVTVHYYSHRTGLAPMVIGLLEGLAKRVNQEISVLHIPKGTRSDHDEFDVTLIPQAESHG